MTIQFECPACRVCVESDDHTRGVMIPCPECRQLVRVPRASAAVAEPVCGNCGRALAANDEYCAACGFAAGTTRFQYAGFWLRVFALAIDALVIMAPATLCIVVFRPILAPLSWEHPGMTRLCLRICGILIGWLYSASMESSSYQATVGKAVFGLRVTDLRGQRITFARATGRYFGKFLSGMLCMIGYLMAGLTERKQALHDMLAETEVVRFQE